MLTRRRLFVFSSIALLAACNAGDRVVAPGVAPSAAATHDAARTLHDGRMVPGSSGQAATAEAQHHPLACTVAQPLSGSAIIGARGGELDVGPHRLIVPAGALQSDTQLSATVPAGSTIEIQFEPHGLQFRKPAGLILDVSSCGPVPNAVYLDEMGGIAEHIEAVFSNWWHTIAAPIDHFSGYMLEV